MGTEIEVLSGRVTSDKWIFAKPSCSGAYLTAADGIEMFQP